MPNKPLKVVNFEIPDGDSTFIIKYYDNGDGIQSGGLYYDVLVRHGGCDLSLNGITPEFLGALATAISSTHQEIFNFPERFEPENVRLAKRKDELLTALNDRELALEVTRLEERLAYIKKMEKEEKKANQKSKKPSKLVTK